MHIQGTKKTADDIRSGAAGRVELRKQGLANVVTAVTKRLDTALDDYFYLRHSNGHTDYPLPNGRAKVEVRLALGLVHEGDEYPSGKLHADASDLLLDAGARATLLDQIKAYVVSLKFDVDSVEIPPRFLAEIDAQLALPKDPGVVNKEITAVVTFYDQKYIDEFPQLIAPKDAAR
jgi:hypothetical protein